MKYAKFSDDFLSDFRLDDNGETLVLTDKRGYTRAVKLLPYEEKPKYFPPCEDCNKKMEEIRQAYDKMKATERPQGETNAKNLPADFWHICNRVMVYERGRFFGVA